MASSPRPVSMHFTVAMYFSDCLPPNICKNVHVDKRLDDKTKFLNIYLKNE